MLTDRRQRILYALIEEYVAHALPVGSQTIAQHYRLGVSSATIRNELSRLEEEGYIVQPHTSAGRIPTDAGYREFVDDVLANFSIESTNPLSSISEELRAHADALDDLIEKTSNELTRLTDCLSIVMAPSIINSHIRQISLISLTDRQALIVIVLQDGQVINQSIDFDFDVSGEDLYKIQSVISELFVGNAVQDVDSIAGDTIKSVSNDPIFTIIVEHIFYALKTNAATKASRFGMSALLKKPEFHDSSSLLPLMEILEDDTVLLSMLDDDMDSVSIDSLMVRIGNENKSEKLNGVSVVAGKYGRGDSLGVVAVIGPKRMNYTHVINAVRAAQDALNE